MNKTSCNRSHRKNKCNLIIWSTSTVFYGTFLDISLKLKWFQNRCHSSAGDFCNSKNKSHSKKNCQWKTACNRSHCKSKCNFILWSTSTVSYMVHFLRPALSMLGHQERRGQNRYATCLHMQWTQRSRSLNQKWYKQVGWHSASNRRW